MHVEQIARTASLAPRPRSAPKPGDVLASRRSARADVFAISVVPSGTHVVAGRYQAAMDTVRELARELAVDGWYTADHTHWVRVARYRNTGSHARGGR
jgi:hypothetical protein